MIRADEPIRARRGAMNVLILVALLLLVVLAAAVLNVYQAGRVKIEGQNAADSAALAGALSRARALNALTAANHLNGQLAALIAQHEGIGGPDVDRRQTISTRELQVLDQVISRVGNFNPELSYLTTKMTQPVTAGAAISDGRVRLRQWALAAYALMSAGKAAAASVVGSGAAPVLSAAAHALAAKLVQEAIALDLLEAAAVAQAPLIKLYRRLLPRVTAYSNRVMRLAPAATSRAVGDAARANGWQADCWPQQPPLPVHRERVKRGNAGAWPTPPGSRENPTRKLVPQADLRPMTTSQWVRAGYPWLVQWRRLVRQLLDVTATLSGAGGSYTRWTDVLLLVRADEALQAGHGLFILLDSSPDIKGREGFRSASGSRRAEELFSLVVVAHRPAPRPAAPALFGSAHRQVVAVARAMVYQPNTNHPGGNGRQPVTGWDTLAWGRAVPEFGNDGDFGWPIMRLGWDATLVPISRAPPIPPGLPESVKNVLRKSPRSWEFWTH